jgi:hypothetical protein
VHDRQARPGSALRQICIRITPTYTRRILATDRANSGEAQHLELPVEELLASARRLPSHDEMAIQDLSEAEGAAFLAAVES